MRARARTRYGCSAGVSAVMTASPASSSWTRTTYTSTARGGPFEEAGERLAPVCRELAQEALAGSYAPLHRGQEALARSQVALVGVQEAPARSQEPSARS